MKYIRLWRFLALLVLISTLYGVYKGVMTNFFFNLAPASMLIYLGLLAIVFTFVILPVVRWLINPTPIDLK